MKDLTSVKQCRSSLSRTGQRNVLLKNKSSRQINRIMLRTMRVVMPMQSWTAVSPLKKIYNLREEVEIAVASLEKGKSAGVDNILAELIQPCGETIIDVLTEISNRIKSPGELPTSWTQSLIITLPKKPSSARTISLISHSSKVMRKDILNRLKPEAEEMLAEEQARFRAGRSTTKQIFNP